MLDIPFDAILLALGGVILLVAWLPLLLKRLPLSLPIVCLGLGVALSFTPWLRASTSSLGHDETLEQLNEAVVLIALMGAGLRLDRPFAVRRWGSTWRLLVFVMPLSIAAIFAAAHWGLGMAAPGALLLGAALAPTDPVLAADVQTGPPRQGEDGETRFGLTSEAGLNDGLALPFVMLAIALQGHDANWLRWVAIDLIGAVVLAGAIGWAIGWVAGYLIFRLPSLRLSDTGDGLVAVGVTLVAFAVTELLHGNGFIAVFIAALTIRSTCPDSEFHEAMSEFSGQVERVLLVLVLIIFGWAIGRGLLSPLTWTAAAVAIAALIAIRPAAAWLGFLGSPVPTASKRLMGFFGIRGIGTLFYLQFAFNRVAFAERQTIWAIAGLTILCSVLLHGVTATPLMNWADARRARKQRDAGQPVPGTASG